MHSNLSSGTEIYTRDGHEIGTVKEVRGDYFKVDAKMQPDYWLPCTCLVDGGTGRVQTTFDKSQLSDNKVGEPATML